MHQWCASHDGDAQEGGLEDQRGNRSASTSGRQHSDAQHDIIGSTLTTNEVISFLKSNKLTLNDLIANAVSAESSSDCEAEYVK